MHIRIRVLVFVAAVSAALLSFFFLTTRDAASAAILAQTGKSAYLVFDEGIRKSLKQIDGYFHLKLVNSGDSIADLAASLEALSRSATFRLQGADEPLRIFNETVMSTLSMTSLLIGAAA